MTGPVAGAAYEPIWPAVENCSPTTTAPVCGRLNSHIAWQVLQRGGARAGRLSSFANLRAFRRISASRAKNNPFEGVTFCFTEIFSSWVLTRFFQRIESPKD
jgi:hypothetical protein